MDLAKYRIFRDAAIVELQYAVVVAAVRDVAVSGADLEAGGPLVHEECRNQFSLAPGSVFLTTGREENYVVRVIRVADEMLGTVDYEIPTPGERRGLHSTYVRARSRFGHRQTVDALAADRRQQIALPLRARAGQ
jgi:hypothetical protein